MSQLREALVPGNAGHIADHDAIAKILNSRFNLRSYGGVGDGVTEDVYALRDAYAAAVAAIDAGTIPAATIEIPAGTWLFNDYQSSADGVQWMLCINHDNITIELHDDAIVTSSVANPGALFIFFAYGGFKGITASGANYYNNRYPFITTTTMTAAAKGDEQVVVASASGISPGDWVYIRTGDVSDASRLVDPHLVLPDSEINQVVSIAGTTLQLRWPLSKPYAQEKYLDASNTGMTSTAGTHSNAPLALAVITGKTIHNFAIRGGRFSTPNAVGYALAEQITNVTFDRITGDYGWTGLSSQCSRNVRMTNWVLNKINTPTDGGYPVAVAFCTNDADIGPGITYGLYPPMLHCHEGAAGIHFHDIHCKSRSSPNSPDYFTGLSIRGRNYGSRFAGIQMAGGSPGDFPIKVEATCTDGGEITGCRVDKTAYTFSMGLAGKGGWWVHDNFVDKPIINIEPTLTLANNYGPGGTTAGWTTLQSAGEVIGMQRYLGGDTGFATPGATPSLVEIGKSGKVYISQPSGATTYTDFLDAPQGVEIRILAGNGNTTIQNNARILLNGSANFAMTSGSSITLVQDPLVGGAWREHGRSAH